MSTQIEMYNELEQLISKEVYGTVRVISGEPGVIAIKVNDYRFEFDSMFLINDCIEDIVEVFLDNYNEYLNKR